MQPVREVYSLLMPVQDGRIIVPRAAVAEVTGFVRPKDRPKGAPDFLLGFIDWQGQKIPLVSFEAARGRGVPELGRRTRIAIVFGIAGRLNPDVFAVVTQGYPYLVRVNENVLQREELNAGEPLMLARVRMANEKPYIPDFEKLEALIADCLGMPPAGNDGAAAASEPVDELDAFGGNDEEELDVGLLDDDETDDVTPSGDSNDAADTNGGPAAELDVDLGEVTAFGTETNYSAELDALSDALTEDTNQVESSTMDDSTEINVDLDEVTVFGTETNYSVELNELSGALEGDEASAAPADDEYAIDLSALELDDSEAAEDKEAADGDKDESDDGGEFDFSGLDFELDDDEKKPE